MMQFFHQNIAALQQTNPILYAYLFGIESNSKYTVFQDSNDSLNVNIYDTEHQTIFYDGIPRDSIIAQVDHFEASFNRYPILFIYGVANGLFIKLLLQNNNHIKIYVIEPELELLFIALNLLDFSQELSDKRVEFLHATNIDFFNAIDIFSHKDIKVFCKTYHIEPNISYYEHYYSDSLLQVNAVLSRAIEHIITGLGNDSTDALIGLEWHLANVEKMIETPTLLELIHQAKTTDIAIIVSTGPSLAKQLPLLESIKDHVTIFSVDASFPILEQYNIKPDIVFSIERVAETAEFYKRTSPEFQKGVICAMSSLSHPALIESVTTGTLQLSMRPFGYTRYFDLPEYGYIGIGMSAANMAYETAYHAKFKTIILIGQDLAYGTEGQSHSDGHVFGSLQQNKDAFEVEAYGGNGTVTTNQIWNMFRNFFENDIYIANQDGITTINATEGGARIFGTVESPFSNVIEKYIDRNIQKTSITLQYPTPQSIEEKKLYVSNKLTLMEDYVKSTQKKVSDLFERVSLNIEKLNRIDARNNLEKVDYNEIATLMGEIDEIKSLFDEQEFIDIFIDAIQALIIHHELEIARIQVRPIQNNNDRKLKMIDWMYTHLHWLFALAGIMQAELIAIQRKGSQSQYIHKAELSEDGTALSGYFYDYQNKQIDFDISCIIDGRTVYTEKINTENRPKGNFWITLPSEYFDNQVHLILLKENYSGIILAGTPINRLLLKEDATRSNLFYVEPDLFKEMHSKNTIGFLAVEENLKDKEFINIIKRITQKYTYKIKAFCLDLNTVTLAESIFEKNKYTNLEIQQVKTIYDIASTITVYLHNMNEKVPNLTPIFEKYSNEIYSIVFNSSMHHSIKSLNDRYQSTKHPLLSDPEYFGISENEVIQQQSKIFHILETKFNRLIPDNFDNIFYIDFLIDYKLKFLLENDDYRHSYINYAKRYNMKYGV